MNIFKEEIISTELSAPNNNNNNNNISKSEEKDSADWFGNVSEERRGTEVPKKLISETNNDNLQYFIYY